MNNKRITLTALLLLMLIMPLSLSACSKKKTIVEINKSKLVLDDFLYDIYLMEQEREHWNNKYKESLGIDYWDYEYKGLTMKQLAKDTIMTRVILYDILSSQAKKEGFTLSDDELATTDENEDKLISSMSEDEFKRTGRSKDILTKVYNTLALGDKYYLSVINNFEVDEEAIRSTVNHDEYREYITECIYIPTAEVRDGKITPYSDSELEEAYDKITEVKRLVQNGADFDEVLKQVEGSSYKRSFILTDKTAEDEYKEACKNLDNGEYSDVITTQFGYYIIHMIDNNSTTRYENAIEEAIANEKTSLFEIHYNKLLENYEININSEYWESIDIGSITS